MTIAQYYNPNNVLVGQAVFYYAPQNTPLFDMNKLFLDPTIPCGYRLDIPGGVTAFTLTVGGQTTGSISTSGMTPATITAAVNALSVVNVSTGSSAAQAVTPTTRWYVYINPGSPLAAGLPITATGTGGTVTVTAPSWTTPGMTDQGWSWSYAPTTQEYYGEEQQTPVAVGITSSTLTITGALIEDTDDNLAFATGGTLATVAPTTTTPGYNQIALSPNLGVIAGVLEYQNEFQKPRYMYVPSLALSGGTTLALRRAADRHVMGITATAICTQSQIIWNNITALHS